MDRSELLKKFGFEDEEVTEVVIGEHGKTGFPKPLKLYKILWEVHNLSLEEPYFWILNTYREYMPNVEKLEDSFAAAENSAFFGVTQQRLGAQQDKISQFLATTGKMIKELFQMVRELRILDERLGYYQDTFGQETVPLNKREKASCITLKGMFVDLVQGGGKSAASVYGMARELEFITLPDLFFDAPPFVDSTELENYVNVMSKDFNKSVLRVLVRHLRNFHEWRKRTYKEHVDRKRFMLKYLEQHFQIIQMYINWIKPYLRHVSSLTLKEKNMRSPDLIAAFEGSMIDVEVLGYYNTPVGHTGTNGCILATFRYRTRPDMKFVGEGYQRGPVHAGMYNMELRVYQWTNEQVQKYREFKEAESMELIGDISSSVKEAMDSLGEELTHYLDQARGVNKKKDLSTVPRSGFMEKMFGDFYTPARKKPKKVERPKLDRGLVYDLEKAKKELKGKTMMACWFMYKNFKKAHRMIQW